MLLLSLFPHTRLSVSRDELSEAILLSRLRILSVPCPDQPVRPHRMKNRIHACRVDSSYSIMAEGAFVAFGTLAFGVKGARLGANETPIDASQVVGDVRL